MDRPPILVKMFKSIVSSLRQQSILFFSYYCLHDSILREFGPWCNDCNDKLICSAPTTLKKDQVFK